MREKICIVTTVHPHGDVRIFHKEAKQLARAGYEVVLLSPDFSGEGEGVRFRALQLPKKRLWRMVRGWRIALTAALLEDAALYHFHDPELLPMGVALHRRGKRVIYDVHEDLPRQILGKAWLPEYLRPPLSKLAQRRENRMAGILDGVVVATETIGKRFPGSVLLRNYPDGEEFAPLLAGDFTPYLQREALACYIGAISQVRGISQMVEALPGTGVRLQLAGAFESPILRRTVERLPDYGQVDYLGVLDRGEVLALLSRCRMGLLLLQPLESYRESLPIKLFEYMLAGLPVIASDFPLWRELAGPEALYVDPRDPAAIGGAIRFLLENPDRAKAMGEAGQKRARERYLLTGEVGRLLKLYEKLLA